MVISKTVKIKIKSSHNKFYKNLGYDFVSVSKNKEKNKENFVEIFVKHLSVGSHVKIKVKCDECGKEKEIQYRGLKDKENLTWRCLKCEAQKLSIQEKRKETCIERYGVSHVMAHEPFFQKMQKSAREIQYYKHLYFQGTYEKDFIDFIENLNLIELIKNGPSVRYFNINGSERHYLSDFFIPSLNLIVEIKSSYMYQDNDELKKKACIEAGFKFIMIRDKKYEEFKNLLEEFLYLDL